MEVLATRKVTGCSVCPHVLQSLQKHHHPDVSKAAALINTALLQQEDDISKVLETTAYQVGLLEAPVTFAQGLIPFSCSPADGAGTAADCGQESPAGV